jgi:hypothetical protein
MVERKAFIGCSICKHFSNVRRRVHPAGLIPHFQEE